MLAFGRWGWGDWVVGRGWRGNRWVLASGSGVGTSAQDGGKGLPKIAAIRAAPQEGVHA